MNSPYGSQSGCTPPAAPTSMQISLSVRRKSRIEGPKTAGRTTLAFPLTEAACRSPASIASAGSDAARDDTTYPVMLLYGCADGWISIERCPAFASHVANGWQVDS